MFANGRYVLSAFVFGHALATRIVPMISVDSPSPFTIVMYVFDCDLMIGIL